MIGEIVVTPTLNTALRIGHELADGGWQQTEHVVLSPVEREALIDYLIAHRGDYVNDREDHGHYLPEGLPTPAESVVVNYLAEWEKPEPEHRAAFYYAAGIAFGQFEPITDWSQLGSVAATLSALREIVMHPPTQDTNIAHSQPAVHEYHAWRLGVRLIHALADGVVASAETGESLGETTRLVDTPVELSNDVFQGNRMTLLEFASTFRGNLIAAAGAFYRAYLAVDYSLPLAD